MLSATVDFNVRIFHSGNMTDAPVFYLDIGDLGHCGGTLNFQRQYWIMLAFAEIYSARILAAKEDNDIIAILGGLAAELGFRSAYIISYSSGLKSALLVLDSNAARAGWWDEYISSGLRTSTKPVKDMLAKGGVQHFDGTRFSDPGDPKLAFARKLDMIASSIVPITFDTELAGLVALCGEKILSHEQESTLLFISYSLFAKAQSFHVSGVRTASANLTPREREVMVLSAEGMTSQEVADRLSISPRTASQHMDNVAEKLGTRNRVHTVAEAIRRSLL